MTMTDDSKVPAKVDTLGEKAAFERWCMRQLLIRGESLEPSGSGPWTGYRCASEGRSHYGRKGRWRLPGPA